MVAGDTVGGSAIRIEPAIEVGNIFKLGTRYSEPLGATYLDETGSEQPIWMGCYGFGPARIAAAAIEQFADEHGISWPRAIAPFDIQLVTLGKAGSEERALADRLYDELRAAGPRHALRRARRRARARSSPTPSCSAARCASPSAAGRSQNGEVEVQVRRGHESPHARRSRARQRRSLSCGATCA